MKAWHKAVELSGSASIGRLLFVHTDVLTLPYLQGGQVITPGQC